MDVHALRVFAEVVRQQGFTRASRTLGLTQPAISKVVAGLEEDLGARLLVRERRRLTLTDAGQVVLARSRSLLDGLRVMQEEVQEIAGLRRGRLRIGSPPIVGVVLLPPLLAAFRAAHPGVAIELREEGSRQIEDLVRSHELDAGAVVLPTDETDFQTLPFARDHLRAVLHPSHPLARRRSVSLRELAGTPFVLYRPDFALRGHILDACRRAGFQPDVVSESAHWDLMVALVAADLGVALLPTSVCRLLDRVQVRTVRLADPIIPWDVALVWRRGGERSPAARAWIELARRRLRGRAG